MRTTITVIALSVGLACVHAQPAAAQNFPIPECRLEPANPVFQAGATVFSHFLSHPGPNAPNTVDGYRILLPDVAHPTHEYPQVPLQGGDHYTIAACGCVQTGGKGRTWKSYVDPIAPDAPNLYHGMISVFYDNPPRPPGGWPLTNMKTLRDWINGQASGLDNPKGHTATLVLGYQDGPNDYGDNGYSGHDDGTEGQCRNVGGAAVQIVITHH